MKNVVVEMEIRAAAAVRQILFEHQRGYTNDLNSVPPRISEIREVIANIDNAIQSVIE